MFILKVNSKNNYFKNRNGSVLAFILIIFLVISIMSTSMLMLFNNNLKQAKHQENSLEAYYLAYSGVEMGLAAINMPYNVAGRTLLMDLKDGTKTQLNSTTDTNTTKTNGHIEFGEGYIDIIINKTTDANFDGWIKITSTGILKKNNHQFTRTMYLDPSNPNNFKWKNN